MGGWLSRPCSGPRGHGAGSRTERFVWRKIRSEGDVRVSLGIYRRPHGPEAHSASRTVSRARAVRGPPFMPPFVAQR